MRIVTFSVWTDLPRMELHRESGWQETRSRCLAIGLRCAPGDISSAWLASASGDRRDHRCVDRRNVTCALGNQVNALQMQQLCTTSGSTVFLSFDSDDNGSGQQAAQRLAGLLSQRRVKALTIELPNGHDPNSFFASGGDARQFRQLIEKAAA